MNSRSSSTLRLYLPQNELPQDAIAMRHPALSTKEIFHRKPGEDFSKKNSSLIARGAHRQVSPRCQPAHQCLKRELPLQRDSLLQSWREAASWE